MTLTATDSGDLVDTATGEIVEFDKAAAERRAERIRLRLDAIADNYAAVMPMIREAIERRDDLALGYRSPGEYVADRFGGALQNLGVEVRREVVRELTSAGMSTRAIAPVVGVSNKTVSIDRGVTPVTPDQTPAPEPEGEADEGAGQTPERGEADPTERVAASRTTETSAAAAAPRAPVTGIDGKTYTPKPKTPTPVLDGNAAEYANAEQASKALARAIAKLLEFEHPNMRAGMRAYWDMASVEVPSAQRADVTAEQMRAAAHGLLTLADEWNR